MCKGLQITTAPNGNFKNLMCCLWGRVKQMLGVPQDTLSVRVNEEDESLTFEDNM